ncbi:alanine--tRNA ligase [Aquimarina sp. U1-2]|uniref:alanine--tRNA ligase n=1 Tax=Aquimarina sp. U1-2 TaxID=2823141 RepID=UPI001AED0FC1|nr:alanine--tRNA ligase [Aquimarina sp. U1-2]
MKSRQIRNTFLDFFKSKNHEVVRSAPMVIKDDPTLMFTNAGMNQFKEYFLGNGTPKSNRITDTQKCLRVSGKHNDLEEVGMDTYHHTMFEMLGNWSFGDYFKKEAIQWAWELLTKVYGIDKDMLYVSVFEGAKDEGLEMDNEAYDLWKEIIPEDRIIMGNKKDNFWEMGDQGPCGPCSEIHVDIRSSKEKAKIPGRELVNADHPQVVEIWNLVFMQYNRKANGSLEKLPAQHVDTGMGFERLCMVLQGVKSNYDTDVFTPLIREIEVITKSTYDKESLPANEDGKVSVAIRVVADHIRAVSFSIADGQLPSNTGAGYVIRRILRRAIRYGFTFLNTKEPFIYKLVDTLVEQMSATFPELKAQKNLIINVVKEEEQSFLRTLDQGLTLLDDVIRNTKGKVVSGKKAFELYDTYGFPIDLTTLIASEQGYTLDENAFENELQKQKERSRAASQLSTGDWEHVHDNTLEGFVGYDQLSSTVNINRFRKINSKKEGNLYQLVFNKTPFYPESGGQVGDKGYLEDKNGDVVYIIDTKKENNLIVHLAKSLPKQVDGEFTAVVDRKQRTRTASNHTATHLLHQALRSILGTHVEQKGSMVHSGNLRFDFSHYAKVSEEELRQVEDFVNARIREYLPLQEKRDVAYDQAISEGAIALFGEKYGDAVRTIRFGESMELCGGTHVPNTRDIWHFKITSESAIAAGVRRIEAITGDAAKEYFTTQSDAFNQVKTTLNNVKNPIQAITSLQEENATLKKQIEALLKAKAKNLKGDLKAALEEKNGIHFLAKKVDLDASGIKDVCFELGGEIDNVFIILGSEQQGKAILSCYISKSLVESKGLNASQIIKELGKCIQGGGGGQPFFATAGGKHPAGIEEALVSAKKYV